MSNTKIGIFVATMTGLAELCAQEIQTALCQAGSAGEMKLMDGLAPDAFDPFDTLVIVSSTYGHGEIPDNGLALFEALEAGTDLKGKRFAVYGLGDRTYSGTFCAAADRWQALLEKAGATRFADTMRHDASAGTFAEDEAAEWAKGWMGLLHDSEAA